MRVIHRGCCFFQAIHITSTKIHCLGTKGARMLVVVPPLRNRRSVHMHFNIVVYTVQSYWEIIVNNCTLNMVFLQVQKVFTIEEYIKCKLSNAIIYSFMLIISFLGKNLAMLELKILLAMILKSCRVKSLQKPEDLDMSFEIVLTNKSGILLEISPRKWFENYKFCCAKLYLYTTFVICSGRHLVYHCCWT